MTNQHPHPAAYLAALFLAADDIIPFDDQNIFHAADIITTAIVEHDQHLDTLQAALVAERTASWPIDPHTGAKVAPRKQEPEPETIPLCKSVCSSMGAQCDRFDGHDGHHTGLYNDGSKYHTRITWE